MTCFVSIRFCLLRKRLKNFPLKYLFFATFVQPFKARWSSPSIFIDANHSKFENDLNPTI